MSAVAATGFEFDATMYTVPGTGEIRTLRTHLWYPTDDTEGTPTSFKMAIHSAPGLVTNTTSKAALTSSRAVAANGKLQAVLEGLRGAVESCSSGEPGALFVQ